MILNFSLASFKCQTCLLSSVPSLLLGLLKEDLWLANLVLRVTLCISESDISLSWPADEKFGYLDPGFVHFSRPNIQGLFKDFPGPYLEISRTFFNDNFTSKPRNTCKPDMRCAVVANRICAKVTKENNRNEKHRLYHIS